MQTDMESDDDDDDDDDGSGDGDGFHMTRLKRHPRDPSFIDKKAELLPRARHDPLSLSVSPCTCAFYPLRCERLFHASVVVVVIVVVVAATPFSPGLLSRVFQAAALSSEKRFLATTRRALAVLSPSPDVVLVAARTAAIIEEYCSPRTANRTRL